MHHRLSRTNNPNRKVRVLFINEASFIGGAETNLLSILKTASEASFEPVAVLLPEHGPLADKVGELGIPVGFIDYHRFSLRNPVRYLQTLWRLVSLVCRTQPDVIHLNHQWLVEMDDIRL